MYKNEVATRTPPSGRLGRPITILTPPSGRPGRPSAAQGRAAPPEGANVAVARRKAYFHIPLEPITRRPSRRGGGGGAKGGYIPFVGDFMRGKQKYPPFSAGRRILATPL